MNATSAPPALLDYNALVTGGGSGIGLACAKAFAAEGAHVTIMGRSIERLETARLEILAWAPDCEVGISVGDVGIEADVEAAVEVASRHGRLDITVANAGVGGMAPLTLTESDSWQQIMQTNLTGTFFTLKHSARVMQNNGGGAICAISSIAGIRTHRYMSAYCTSKAGIDMLIKNAADELGHQGIRVNSVCPGLVATEIAAGLMASDDIYADYLDCMPLGRSGTVEDISQAVRFLCGPEASWITGVVLSVDGGHHLRRGPNLDARARGRFGDALSSDKGA